MYRSRKKPGAPAPWRRRTKEEKRTPTGQADNYTFSQDHFFLYQSGHRCPCIHYIKERNNRSTTKQLQKATMQLHFLEMKEK